MTDMAQCWINGQQMPGSEVSISVFNHGLLYGDGVFEGIRFYNGRAFRRVIIASTRRLPVDGLDGCIKSLNLAPTGCVWKSQTTVRSGVSAVITGKILSRKHT